MDILVVLFWATVGSVFSMVGGIILLKFSHYRDAILTLALPFGAGALLAAAFFDLLPESFHDGEPNQVALFALIGFMAFFLLERFITGFHAHAGHEHGRVAAQKSLIISSDVLHNAIDGAAIGAAFLISVPFGIVTTLAVAAHEIPKEIGNFGLLLARGMRPLWVFLANALSAVASLVMAVLVYTLGSSEVIPIAPLLAVTAGFFIYIAAADIIPEIHEQTEIKKANIQTAMLIFGIVIVGVVIVSLEGMHAH